MEPTSEQELKQLLDEGKITEDEYRELLEAIRQKKMVQKPVEVMQKPGSPRSRCGYGKGALALMILGLFIPVVIVIVGVILRFLGLGSTRGVVGISAVFLLLILPCFLLAFILGIIGWKTPQGKIAAIGVPCLVLLIVPGLLLFSLISFKESRQVAMGKAVTLHQPAVPEIIPQPFETHKHYNLDSPVGLLTQDGTQFDINIDHNNSSDGRASLKITSDSAHQQVLRLFETGPVDVENCMLIYSASLKGGLGKGKAYLEMWCDIPGKGEFFSRGLDHAISGETEWTTVETPFWVAAGQMPSNVKLNLVVEGTGTVWIDDIKLLSRPLN